ncbi:hypothetical protein BGZ92_007118 [Podila epicladia]|nr:hypothetical protein BGZ92_007118 [Podila epicladia]
MDDQIRSESSFFWKLSIQPTVFTAPFCESFKRSFQFEPKTGGKARHLWQCDITEDMINGAATMTIDIHRANFEISSTSPPPTGSVAVMSLSQRSRSEVLEQPELKQEHQEYLPGISKDVEYRTIFIHTPKYFSPLMSSFLRGRCTDSIRELDASELLYEGKYVIVLTFSEGKAISQITSPSSYLRIMDSIYHDILPTVQPDPDSADVWFEFPDEVVPPEQQQQLPRLDGDGSVVTIGAHWCVLSKYESLVRWIEYERQVEQEQQRQEEERVRRGQYEAEMRFLHQQRVQKEMMQQQEMQRLHGMHQRQYPPQQAQMHVVEPAQMYHHPPQMHTRASMGAMLVPTSISMSVLPQPMQGQQYFCDPYNPHFPQRASVMPFQSLPHQTPQHQSYYHAPFSGLQDPTCPKSHPPNQPQLPPSWQQLPQRQDAPVPPHHPSSDSSPTLGARTHNIIRVKQFSSSTFRVLLQYLYTGQIGLTGEQQRNLEKYSWLDQSPTRNDDNGQDHQDEDEESVEVLEQGRVQLPSSQPPTGNFSLEPQLHRMMPGAASRDESEKSLGPIRLPPLEPMAHESDGGDGPSQFAQMLARMTQDTISNDDYTSTLQWLPCSRHLVATDDQCAYGSLDMLDPAHSPSSCTWESLVHVSQVLGLQDLHGRAAKALGYHCQMLVVRTFMHSGVAEVAHSGFNETQLDLQLAMNKDLLGAFLELYRKKWMEEGVKLGKGLVVPVERRGEASLEKMKHNDDGKESVTAPSLLDGAECQDQILGLCKDIRSLFLDLQNNMDT